MLGITNALTMLVTEAFRKVVYLRNKYSGDFYVMQQLF